jgi:SAM-dependent methyltransferase
MIFESFADGELNWLPEIGIGYYPVKDAPYNEDYFAKYQVMAETEIGIALNQARLDLVNKYTKLDVLDIGIGSGAFVQARENSYGFDINPYAVDWLIERGLYRHPFRGANSLTFWDSLEHIHDPRMHLQNAKEYVFVSCPIYRDAEHIKASKHFRKDEHCWYWTHDGLLIFMFAFGFELIEHNTMESDLGREDIGTFVFKRK